MNSQVQKKKISSQNRSSTFEFEYSGQAIVINQLQFLLTSNPQNPTGLPSAFSIFPKNPWHGSLENLILVGYHLVLFVSSVQ